MDKNLKGPLEDTHISLKPKVTSQRGRERVSLSEGDTVQKRSGKGLLSEGNTVPKVGSG